MEQKNIYQENGYRNRRHYLETLAEDYGIDVETVLTLASVTGPAEDFDGLIIVLQDYADEVHCD